MKFFDPDKYRHNRDYADCIFVFGSNLAGRHGKGAALFAQDVYGAVYGVGIGRTGKAYAIPTKDEELNTLALEYIGHHVKAFIEYARHYKDETFFVTRVGCGLAGYTDAEIAPMFRGSPDNCIFDIAWKEHLISL
jgi:hypothetical protein